jgi:hypothetical protein
MEIPERTDAQDVRKGLHWRLDSFILQPPGYPNGELKKGMPQSFEVGSRVRLEKAPLLKETVEPPSHARRHRLPRFGQMSIDNNLDLLTVDHVDHVGTVP